MINISKYTKLLFLCLSSIIVFTSCEDDETVFDRIVGYEWVGDLGFADRYGPLESGLFLREMVLDLTLNVITMIRTVILYMSCLFVG